MQSRDTNRKTKTTPVRSAELLDADDPSAFEIINIDGTGNAVLVCDHASNRVPRRLKGLGLGPADLSSHIAWDPGAARVARELSRLLDAPLILSGYSRLVIDCNRPLDSTESVPALSHGIPIPGNRHLKPDDRARRVSELFNPYHAAIEEVLDRRTTRLTLLLSIHSFAPSLGNGIRPWHVGFAYGKNSRLASLMLDATRDERTIVAGDNQPYAVEDAFDYTIPYHGERRGLNYVLVEVRQDMVSSPDDAKDWALRLAKAYQKAERPFLR